MRIPIVHSLCEVISSIFRSIAKLSQIKCIEYTTNWRKTQQNRSILDCRQLSNANEFRAIRSDGEIAAAYLMF